MLRLTASAIVILLYRRYLTTRQRVEEVFKSSWLVVRRPDGDTLPGDIQAPAPERSKHRTSGLGLRIKCRLECDTYYVYGNCTVTSKWFNREKLMELGFKLQPLRDKGARRFAKDKELPRQVYIVLEYDGAAHQGALAKAEQELNASSVCR